MGLRFSKRINLGNGVGLNVSKSGISPSIRTGIGSFGSRGFSIRTGIPGLSYRGGGKNAGTIILLMILVGFAFLIIYNLIRFVFWFLAWVFSLIFQEQGVNYRNLLIVLLVSGSLSGVLYYNWPLFQFPIQPKFAEPIPVVVKDTVVNVPVPVVKKKKNKKKKKKVAVVTIDSQSTEMKTEATAKPVEETIPQEQAAPVPLNPENSNLNPETFSPNPHTPDTVSAPQKKKKKRWWRRKGD